MICNNLPSIIAVAVLALSSNLSSASPAQTDSGELPDWSLVYSFHSEGELCAIIWHEGDEERHYQHGVLINLPSWIWTCGSHRITHKATNTPWNFLMLPHSLNGFLYSYQIDKETIAKESGSEIIDLGNYSKAFEPISKSTRASFINWGRKWEVQEDWEVLKIQYDPPQWRKVPIRMERYKISPEAMRELKAWRKEQRELGK